MKKIVMLIMVLLCVKAGIGQDYSITTDIPKYRKSRLKNGIEIKNLTGYTMTITAYVDNTKLGSGTGTFPRQDGRVFFNYGTILWWEKKGLKKYKKNTLKLEIDCATAKDKYEIPQVTVESGYYHHKHNMVVAITSRPENNEEYKERINNKLARNEKTLDELRSAGENAFNNRNYELAAEHFELAAMLSENVFDQYNAGLCFDISNQFFQASFWYEKAAEQGSEQANKELTRVLYNAGLDYDKKKFFQTAITYYEKAYKLGDANSANNLGIIYEKGHGVVFPDKRTALLWYNKGAVLGSEIAKNNYNRLKQNMESAVSSSTPEPSSNAFLDLMDAAVQTLNLVNDIKNGGSNSSLSNDNGNEASSGSYNNSSSSTSSSRESDSPQYIQQKCDRCAGTGHCSAAFPKQKVCHGSGKCDYCYGEGWVWNSYGLNEKHKCAGCDGTGKCSVCGGTGKCKKCNGSGKITKRL